MVIKKYVTDVMPVFFLIIVSNSFGVFASRPNYTKKRHHRLKRSGTTGKEVHGYGNGQNSAVVDRKRKPLKEIHIKLNREKENPVLKNKETRRNSGGSKGRASRRVLEFR